MKEKVKEKKKYSAFEWVSLFLIAVLMLTTIITTILIANLNDKKKALERENEQVQTDSTYQNQSDDIIIEYFNNQLQ